MTRAFLTPALLFLAASVTAQATLAQTKDPVAAALRDILPGDRKTRSRPSKPCPETNSTTNPAPTR
jgi:hypothetical protein